MAVQRYNKNDNGSDDALGELIKKLGPDDAADHTTLVFSQSPLKHSITREWYNWLNVVDKLRARGIEINDDDDLADALNGWGDALQALRIAQLP